MNQEQIGTKWSKLNTLFYTYMSEQKETKLDSVVTSVINSFKQRAEFGQKKYGTNLDRTDLSVLDWIQHAQEEHMDAILYLEKLKQLHTKEKPVITTTPKVVEEDKHLSHWGC
jgi:hypothetical protein